ncbi:gamma-glutamyltransferase [Pseudogemmatithrix spongiicola]|uniref:Gamma-glutamyltransferase n=1 Tax=Pseudogemmatithrix spongiicola TaxID=3062599 RepID=A0AA49Q913_9BACT|nr:gamma-glutamyltransferase [Gemmatimonadaceae bacterium 'strain 138']WKW16361.1 gamma-glutamyltransferase [Gemmatimonadaceae bacterium 'strain 318']
MRLHARLIVALTLLAPFTTADAQRTERPPLHGQHWVAVTGKPLAATAGAMIFQQGGNAVDAAVAMLAATCTMWDTLGCGGETQALIYHPGLKKVIGINGLGVAPTGATAEYFRSRGMQFPPEFGPLAAVTPGTPGALMVMLAEYGTMSLAQVLAPALQMAEQGYPIEAQLANGIHANRERIKQWKYSPSVFLPNTGQEREAPVAGQIFRQADLAATFRKLIDAEAQALRRRRPRKEAIMAAYERFYRGDIAEEIVRAVQEEGGLFTREDLANWQVKIEEPFSTTYRGVEVYKLQQWQQGPVMLQALNILENADLRGMGYNSAQYIHTVYQAMNLAYADRDFYYGDPAFAPEEPMRGLLSKEYARSRWGQMSLTRNDARVKPGDPYPFQGGTNPYTALLERWSTEGPRAMARAGAAGGETLRSDDATFDDAFTRGTTSIQAADKNGWMVSITPSGGWVPAVIAGRTGIGLSQRMQSFVTDPEDGPFNVIEPGKRPRVTLTPTIAMKDGEPWMAFSVQGGDTQDQDLLQFFLAMVEFNQTPQQAAEHPGFHSYQMRSSFGAHEARPGRLQLNERIPSWVRDELRTKGYSLEFATHTSGPITAIMWDRRNRSFWGAASNNGEDYGIAW